MYSTVKNFMSAKVFIDTNILVYAFSTKRTPVPDPRIEVAEQIVIQGGAISVQVLNEFAQVCSSKAHLDWDRIIGLLQVIKELCGPAVSITLEIHETAVALSGRYEFSIYDSLILAAAMRAGCTTVYSEDLQHGQVVEGMRIENPFLGR
jgi:predicted nucleic acid-binding protein